MQVRIHAVGYLKKYTREASQSVVVEVEPGASVAALLAQLGIPEGEVLRVAVNEVVVGFDTALAEGDAVRIIPPIAGG